MARSAQGTTGSRRRRGGQATPFVPLGSLTQQPVSSAPTCGECGSTRVTRLELQLTDGTPVEFTSCHRCESRSWNSDGVSLPVEVVLERSRRV